ncbi:MscL family protein [Mycoplasma sp. Mirounga ES2805-ORL]|uniref:MscL family protein n=1 Tax=Mycoplasma sp. Mirounga ES2805-ORL TaxID=754514 RepID=UPI00197B5E7A|nr:MscL family protein [Mycoplasma sp. Mirounga ES2805-ORL]QSF13612.1 MscL family protein [Mycoplasma sp. Mirounga ES2805-ORL]
MFKKSMSSAWGVVKRGNMFMLAIGLLLGAAFNELVKSLSNDVIMASIANSLNVAEVKDLKWGPVLIGKFLAALLSFIIISLIIFIMLTTVFFIREIIISRKAKKNPVEEHEPEPSIDEKILVELKLLNKHFNDKNNKFK